MCEILLRVADKVPRDDPRHHLFLGSGDVVVICPDGHSWSEIERTNPEWRILYLPLVTESEASALLSARRPEPGLLGRRRAFGIDVGKLPDDVSGWTWVDLWQAKESRPSEPDLRFLGGDPRVMG